MKLEKNGMFKKTDLTLYKGFQLVEGHLWCIDYDFGPEDEIVGKTFDLHLSQKDLRMCHRGFHGCDTASKVTVFYRPSRRIYEIQVPVAFFQSADKFVFSRFTVVRKLSDPLPANEGEGNTGNGNVGANNSGNLNLGACNTGTGNTGDFNAGKDNVGTHNAGDDNVGDYNTGNQNAGQCNAGSHNVGDDNTGNHNTGTENTGRRNIGDSNTGAQNSGHRNSGDCNIGHCNSGSYNTGECNCGEYNTGDYNTGNYNCGNNNSGVSNIGNNNTGWYNLCDNSANVFDVEEPKIKILGFQSTLTLREWAALHERGMPLCNRELMSQWRRYTQASEEEYERAVNKYFEVKMGKQRE